LKNFGNLTALGILVILGKLPCLLI